MGRIVISLSGEGRGHAARMLTLLESLADHHEILVLAPDSINAFLHTALRHLPAIRHEHLPGLSFHYKVGGQLSYGRSLLHAVPFVVKLPQMVRHLSDTVQRFAPDLAIADFEPLLPRVSAKLGLRCLSLDHQHFLQAVDPRALPTSLRRRLLLLRPSVKLFCPRADIHLVSSFYRYPQRTNTAQFEQVGVLLRRELMQQARSIGKHLVVYARRGASATWAMKLKSLDLPVRLYGFDREGRDHNLDFRPISTKQFLDDLCGSCALVTTAGNQLVGEALAVGKPVLAIPEAGNFEQQLNGFFLQQSGYGQCVAVADVSPNLFRNFLDKLDCFRESIQRFSEIGNARVLEVIEQMIGGHERIVEHKPVRHRFPTIPNEVAA